MSGRVILASGSPRRRVLLGKVLEEFEVVPSNAEEHVSTGISPAETTVKNALTKVLDVARKHPDAMVMGADTVVALEGNIMGKPSDREDAVRMLRALSGRTHLVVTGVAVVDMSRGIRITDSETTVVTFRDLSREQIERYVREREPMDKAGAYGIQEVGDEFVESLEGDYDNVVGLPVGLLRRMLNVVSR